MFAPDLWWGENTRAWATYIATHTPYDTGIISPSVAQVQKLAMGEDVTKAKSAAAAKTKKLNRHDQLSSVLRSHRTID